VDTVFFKRLYVLMFVHVGTRRVLAAECTAEPNSDWVTQQARNLSWQLEEEGIKLSLVIASEGHLRRVVHEYVLHYNDERPHRSRDLSPPLSRGDPARRREGATINRRERLGGLLSEYFPAHEAA
jgi:hypothetical protein